MSLVRLLGFTTLLADASSAAIARSRPAAKSATSRKRASPAAATAIAGTTRSRPSGSSSAVAPASRDQSLLSLGSAAPASVCPEPATILWPAPDSLTYTPLAGRKKAAMPVLLKPYAIVRGPRSSSQPLLPRRLPRGLQAAAAAKRRRHRDVAALQPRHPLQPVPGHALAVRVPGVDRRLGRPPPRVLEPDGSLFLNVGTRPSDPWTALDVAQAARAHLRLQNIIHWIKSIAIERDSAGAAAGLDARPGRRPLQADQQRSLSERLPRVHLPLHARRRHDASTGWRSACPTRTSRTSPGGGPAADGVRCRGNTWFIPYETIQRRDRDRPHPATFPSGCPSSACGCTASSRIETVMDPFTGLGSTAVACARLGVNFIGAEIDETYLAEAVERVARGGGRRAARARERRG